MRNFFFYDKNQKNNVKANGCMKIPLPPFSKFWKILFGNFPGDMPFHELTCRK